MILIAAGTFILVLWIYVLIIRPKLIEKFPEFGAFTRWEAKLFRHSRTILVARGYWIGGILVGAQQLAAAAGLDVTPFVNELAKWIPEAYRGLAISGFLLVTGVAFEWLRRKTTAPLGASED